MEEYYCANCETEATHITSKGTPLCTTCAIAYEWGQASAHEDAPSEIDNEDNELDYYDCYADAFYA